MSRSAKFTEMLSISLGGGREHKVFLQGPSFRTIDASKSWFLRCGLLRPASISMSMLRDRPLIFTRTSSGTFFNARDRRGALSPPNSSYILNTTTAIDSAGRALSTYAGNSSAWMEQPMRNLAISLVLGAILFSPGLAAANDKKKDVPVAPLPTAIVNAKRIFLSNGGGSNLAYDAFYSKMKEWGRYEIVGSPEDADLIIELSYRVEDKGTRVWSSTNTYNNTTQVHSTQIIDPQLILTIYDAKTKNSLWSEN